MLLCVLLPKVGALTAALFAVFQPVTAVASKVTAYVPAAVGTVAPRQGQTRHCDYPSLKTAPSVPDLVASTGSATGLRVFSHLALFCEFIYYDTISYFVKVNEVSRYGKNVAFNAEDAGQRQSGYCYPIL
jgi:hypothetical protein